MPKTYLWWCKCGRSNVSKKNRKNFGDIITPYLYKCITGCEPLFAKPESGIGNVHLGAGTLLNIDAIKKFKNLIVWGTGMHPSDKGVPSNLKILSVRGKLTRNELLKLGYDCPEIYGDIGLLLSKFYNPSVVKKYKLGIIPHFSEYEKCVTLFGNMKNVLVIDLCREIEPVIDDILSCEQTMSSSLHGIIESHAYGISCCWFMFNDTEQKLGGGKFKFKDYYSSVSEKEFEPVILADKGYSLNELVNICTPYVNPQFPIEIDDIINSCPF